MTKLDRRRVVHRPVLAQQQESPFARIHHRYDGLERSPSHESQLPAETLKLARHVELRIVERRTQLRQGLCSGATTFWRGNKRILIAVRLAAGRRRILLPYVERGLVDQASVEA